MFLAVEWCDVVVRFCFHCLLNIGLLQIQITMSMEGIYSFGPLVSLCVTAPFLYFMLHILPTVLFWQKKEMSVDWGPENVWALLFNWMKWVLFPTYLHFLWGENLAPLKSVAIFLLSTTRWRVRKWSLTSWWCCMLEAQKKPNPFLITIVERMLLKNQDLELSKIIHK